MPGRKPLAPRPACVQVRELWPRGDAQSGQRPRGAGMVHQRPLSLLPGAGRAIVPALATVVRAVRAGRRFPPSARRVNATSAPTRR